MRVNEGHRQRKIRNTQKLCRRGTETLLGPSFSFCSNDLSLLKIPFTSQNNKVVVVPSIRKRAMRNLRLCTSVMLSAARCMPTIGLGVSTRRCSQHAVAGHNPRITPMHSPNAASPHIEQQESLGLDLDRILKTSFGHDSFRKGQREVIEIIMQGHSALAVFPTGIGKSLCYQMSALLMPSDGLTVVISPLISLMRDQLLSLSKRGLYGVDTFGSSQTFEERTAAHHRVEAGETKLLFLSPEQLVNDRTRTAIGKRRIDLLVVDEAHCISEWGNSFRPDYLRIREFAKASSAGRVLALTATANRAVVSDICRQFNIDEAKHCLRMPSFRSNLSLRFHFASDSLRLNKVISLIRSRMPSPAIVYVTTVEGTDFVCEALKMAGLNARKYHGQMESAERSANQEWFMSNNDAIIVGTIAFGMGIDKSDIRTIVHYNLPKSVESYVQEVGRAGRDGLAAQCHAFASAKDLTKLESFACAATPSANSIYQMLCDFFTPSEIDPVSHVRKIGLTYGKAFDLTQLNVQIILAFLDLRHKLVQNLSPIYAKAQLRFTSSAPISTMPKALRQQLIYFDDDVRDVICAMCRTARTICSIDLEELSRRLTKHLAPQGGVTTSGCTADGIVEEVRRTLFRIPDVKATLSGTINRYRILAIPSDLLYLARTEVERSHTREQAELERVRQVVNLARTSRCKPAVLLEHFQDDVTSSLGESSACGHCSSCLPSMTSADSDAASDEIERREMEWQFDQIRVNVMPEEQWQHVVQATRESSYLKSSPRAMARFALGFGSPLMGELKEHRHYGCCAEFVSWSHVLRLCEEHCGVLDSQITTAAC